MRHRTGSRVRYRIRCSISWAVDSLSVSGCKADAQAVDAEGAAGLADLVAGVGADVWGHRDGARRCCLGLDQPALQRYLMWLLHFLQGDLGTSLTNGRSIAADLMPRLYNTLFLASYAALVVIPLSILLGIASAIWQNSLFAAGRGASAGHRQHRARHAFAAVIR